MNNNIYEPQTQVGLNNFLGKMYGFMAAAVGVSALVAWLSVTVFYQSVFAFFVQNKFAMLLLLVVQMGLAISMSFKADRNPALSILTLFLFAAIEGLFFGVVLLVYTAQDITMAFVSAAVVFVVLAAFGTTTKKDLSGIGRQAMAALIALVIVSLINLFLQSSAITYVFSFIGVIIFSALTAWDSQKFRQMYLQYGSQINPTNLALMGALQLYLDFVNIFLYLLQIFGMGNSKD